MIDKETLKEFRKQFDDLVDQLEWSGICIKRECMCDSSAVIVKMNHLLTTLETATV